MLAVYGSFLFFQLKTHAHLFEDGEEEGGEDDRALTDDGKSLDLENQTAMPLAPMVLSGRAIDGSGGAEGGGSSSGDAAIPAVPPQPSARLRHASPPDVGGTSARLPQQHLLPEATSAAVASARPRAESSSARPPLPGSARKGVLKTASSHPPAPHSPPTEPVDAAAAAPAAPAAASPGSGHPVDAASGDTATAPGFGGSTAGSVAIPVRRSQRPVGTASAAVDAVVASAATASSNAVPRTSVGSGGAAAHAASHGGSFLLLSHHAPPHPACCCSARPVPASL